jgi:hypothetical protein
MSGRDVDDEIAGRGPGITRDDGPLVADPNPPAVLVPPVHLQPFLFINDYPKDRNNGWHHNVQGVTHDDRYWFVTQRYRLWKFPVAHDLDGDVDGGEPGVSYVDLDELSLPRYNHFGDLDHYAGRLYVPLEDADDGETTPAVAVFDARDLSLITHGRLPAQQHDKHAPWCAINPRNGLLYSSSSWINEDHGHVQIYRRSPVVSGALQFVGTLTLRDEHGKNLSLDVVQGGVFSGRGNLYLVSDTAEGGILGFDGETGRMIGHTVIDYDPEGDSSGIFDLDNKEELEGITIWDLDSGLAPGIRGQVHVLMVDHDVSSDDNLYFKHFRIRAADRDRF